MSRARAVDSSGASHCRGCRPEAEVAAVPVVPARAASGPHEGYVPRILLAEDNPMNQKLAVRLLKLGYPTEVVGNGQEAVDAVRAGGFDIVLMDVQMPELDGLEATRRIRAQAPTPRPWIVAMTANAMEGDREACLAAGMDGYISKPIRPEALAEALSAATEGRDRSPDVSAVGNDLAAARARIAELEAATAALEQQQRVQAALYRIAETANAARDLQEFYASIHEIVAGSCTARTSSSPCSMTSAG